MKILFVANTSRFFSNFLMPLIHDLLDRGYAVYLASSGDWEVMDGVVYVDIGIQREPFARRNWGAFKALLALMKQEHFDIVHCHTPMGGVLARLAAWFSREKMKVVYTAHGFHFFRGSSLTSWLAYFTIEYLLSWVTDDLILINQEDYACAHQYRFHAGHIHLVHGVGIQRVDHVSFHFKDSEKFEMTYIAELSDRKNQYLAIDVLSVIKKTIPDAVLNLVGDGPNLDRYKQYVTERGLVDSVIFHGYIKPIESILNYSDIIVFTSIQEGLPVAVMEAMAYLIPVVATDIRGCRDLIEDRVNGVLEAVNADDIAARVVELYQNPLIALEYTRKSSERLDRFEAKKVNKDYIKIYES